MTGDQTTERGSREREFLTSKGLALPAGEFGLFCKPCAEDVACLRKRGRISVQGGIDIIPLALEFKDWMFEKFFEAYEKFNKPPAHKKTRR
jgi:hypothetical protein